MNNLPSYCGLVGAKIRASDKDLPVHNSRLLPIYNTGLETKTHAQIWIKGHGRHLSNNFDPKS